MESKVLEIKKALNEAYPKFKTADFVKSAFQTVMNELWIFYVGKSKSAGRMEAKALDYMKNTMISAFRGADLDKDQRSIWQYEDLFNKEVEHLLHFASARHGGMNTISKGDTIIEQSNGML